MNNRKFDHCRQAKRQVPRLLTAFFMMFASTLLPLQAQTNASVQLHDDPNKAIVQAHCTGCHSAALITQNRLTRQGWLDTIRWMQDKQGLWPLGDQEEVILDYLEKYYFPQTSGRRKPLPAHLLPANE